MNRYTRLIAGLTAVLLCLLLVCRMNRDSENVIAGEAATAFLSEPFTAQALGNEPEKVLIAADAAVGMSGEGENPSEADPGEIEIPDFEVPGAEPDTGLGETEEARLDENADVNVQSTEAAEAETAGAASGDGSTAAETTEEGTAENEEAPDAEQTEEAEEEIPEPEITEHVKNYKGSAEFPTFESLLVTSAKYYNAEVVERAHAIPTESNDARYQYILGTDYYPYTIDDPPKGYASDSSARKHMVTIDVPVWKMDDSGGRYSDTWSFTTNEKLVDAVRCIFSDIYLLDIKFPFNRLNGYAYRKVGGSGLKALRLISIHTFGCAMDINLSDPDNDFYLGKGNDLRNKDNPYYIPEEVIEIFESYGWFWGGDFDICTDTMHFQYFGLEFLQFDSDEPLPILYRGAEGMNKTYVQNLQKRLVKLGYLTKTYSSFNKKTEDALKEFQTDMGLEPTGITNYDTWVPLINLTHDMSFVF